jgi:hypothetical protein
MKGPHAAARDLTAEELEVECTHCGIPMTERARADSQVRYFYCTSCRRCFSSVYSEIFRVDAKVRIQPKSKAAPPGEGFAVVKERLEQWLAGLDGQDPCRVMGVSPRASADVIRNRYKELALERHPDRGGSAESMMELNLAYSRVTRHCESARFETRARPGPRSSALPPKRR